MSDDTPKPSSSSEEPVKITRIVVFDPASVNSYDVTEALAAPDTALIRVRRILWGKLDFPVVVVEGQELTEEELEQILKGGERVDNPIP